MTGLPAWYSEDEQAEHIPGLPPAYPGEGGLVSRPGAGGAPSLPRPPRGQPIVFPWWLYEMPGSQDWNADAINFSVAASGTTNVPATGNYLAPPATQAVIKQLILTVQNPVATLDLFVRLLLNGSPIPGWSVIYFPPVAAAALVLPINDMVIRMSEGQTLTAQFIEGGGTAYTCSFQVKGWYTPQTTIDTFMSGVPY